MPRQRQHAISCRFSRLGEQALTGVFPALQASNRSRSGRWSSSGVPTAVCCSSPIPMMPPRCTATTTATARASISRWSTPDSKDRIIWSAWQPLSRRRRARHRQQRRDDAEGVRRRPVCRASASIRPARSSPVLPRRHRACAGFLLRRGLPRGRGEAREDRDVDRDVLRSRRPDRLRARDRTRSSPTTASGISSRATCHRCCGCAPTTRSATSTSNTTRSAWCRRSSTRADLRVIDVLMNAVNGGSFAVTAAKRGNARSGQPRRDRLAARAGGPAWACARRGPIAISRSACSAIATILRRLAACAARRRQEDPRLWRVNQGQRGAAVLRHQPTR